MKIEAHTFANINIKIDNTVGYEDGKKQASSARELVLSLLRHTPSHHRFHFNTPSTLTILRLQATVAMMMMMMCLHKEESQIEWLHELN